MPEVIIAENAGFCFGVKRAVEKVFSLASESGGRRIYTLGHLIHNPQIIAELEERGVKAISEEEIDALLETATEDSPCTLVFRAHGVKKELSDRLRAYAAKNPAFEVCDMTCPYVEKIHRIVSEHPDRHLIVFGDAEHPEVRGIVSHSPYPAAVITSSDEVLGLNLRTEPVIAVAQTTQNAEEWKKTKKNIEKYYTNAKIFDTICVMTSKRQTEAAELAAKVDLMIVIGGRESSNTNKLYATSKKVLDRTYLIENVGELDKIEFSSRVSRIGITAGASTPGSIIQEVEKQMSELETKENGAESFEELLEASLKTLNTGDTVSGVITTVTAGELHVDLGAKVTGIIPYDEITDDSSVKLADVFKPGDEIEAMVVKVSDRDGVATLSKKRIDNKLKWRNVLDAYKDETVVEGVVTDVIKGGVLLNYDGNKLFVPASQTGVPKDGDLETLKGKTVKAKIIEINEGRKRAVASIRKVASEERKAKEAEFWANIEVGKVYEGEVKSLTSYGAFVDLGGVDGMVHSSELSWTRIKNPAEVVSVGEVIKVFVKEFNPETKRISLGYKTEETNPWNVFTSKYSVGDVAEVKVVSLMPFGAFAEVVPGTDGLIHISQITDHKIGSPAEVLSVGQVVTAQIIGIDNDSRQISLSIRALMEESSDEDEAVGETAEEAAEDVTEEASEEAAEAPAED